MLNSGWSNNRQTCKFIQIHRSGGAPGINSIDELHSAEMHLPSGAMHAMLARSLSRCDKISLWTPKLLSIMKQLPLRCSDKRKILY